MLITRIKGPFYSFDHYEPRIFEFQGNDCFGSVAVIMKLLLGLSKLMAALDR